MVRSPSKPTTCLAKTAHFTKRSKDLILALHAMDIHWSIIAKQTGCSRATVFRTIRNEAFPKSVLKKQGRPRKTSPEQDKWLIQAVEDNRKLVPRQIKQMLQDKYGVQLCERLIRRRLQLAGLQGSLCARKPLLSKKKTKQRGSYGH
jgi:transposase